MSIDLAGSVHGAAVDTFFVFGETLDLSCRRGCLYIWHRMWLFSKNGIGPFSMASKKAQQGVLSDFSFQHKPILIGGKAMEAYGLRKAGDDIGN
jgi:hypothetical protein